MFDWETHAARLADEVAHPLSRWHGPLATTPRHVFVPRWWQGRELVEGAADPERWMRTAYENASLVTRVGPLHADHATAEDRPEGLPTSSSTLPGLVVGMYRHAMIGEDSRVLVTTGSGYGTALACKRLGDERVTSVDVDPYLVGAATERLDSIGLRPTVRVCDITGELPGEYDRIVSTVSVRRVPVSWLTALLPGGRLVTTLADTGLIVSADKLPDGGAFGRVELDGAGFMVTRHGEDYPPGPGEMFDEVRGLEGEEVHTGRYPVLDVRESWDVWSMLSLTVPGVEHRYEEGPDRRRTAWMVHADGSWARAEGRWTDPPTVHQGGPRRLWDELERIRHRLNVEGGLPVYGAAVRIYPDGRLLLKRGAWSAAVE
ncbi:protein-L-isoaspartate(D-aspartate) O-methyltransferase [Streptomyces sp. NPDC059578]|uniref:protein-L-isoaspartate(D-aspartate) O-methyltransferase n=1 Tax=Streptomyces sp. NPDC059578 TaxID=3346874 RepID=UPI00369A6FA4